MPIINDDAGPVTAADLITILSKLPPDQIICFPRDEGGFSPVTGYKQMTLLENVNKEYWYGCHDYPESQITEERNAYPQSEFIVLLR
jgi:hypothetical protein